MFLTQFTSKYRAQFIVDAYSNWIKKKSQALDVGCGTGIVTQELSINLGIKIIGCDIDKYLVVDIPFIKMSSRDKIPASLYNFDFVMFNDVLHHMSYKDQENFLKQAIRVSPKILIFEDRPTLIGKISDLLLNKIHHAKMPLPLSFRSAEEWQKLFRKLNMKYTYIAIPKPFWYPFSHIAFHCSRIDNI